MPQFLPLGANSTVSVCTGGGQRIGFYPPLHSPLQQPLWSPVCVAFNPSVTAAALIHLHGVRLHRLWFTSGGHFVLRLVSCTSACEQDWECPKNKKHHWLHGKTRTKFLFNPHTVTHIHLLYPKQSLYCAISPARESKPERKKKKKNVYGIILSSQSERGFSSPVQLPCASRLKPTGHRGLGLHLNEPSVFTHSKPGPQLWLCCTHSLMSGGDKHTGSWELKKWLRANQTLLVSV